MSDVITDHLRHHRVVNDALIAHRGASALAPENTLVAMRKAAQLGAKWLEVDVKLTRDRQPVIIHDDRVDRTTNGRGLVAGLTLADIRQLEARAQFGDAFAGVTIPTLQELIACVLELDMGLQLELKPTAGDDVETAEVALGVLKSMLLQETHCQILHCLSELLDDEAQHILADSDIEYAVAVVNDAAQARRFLDNGAQTILSDIPDLLG